MNSLQQIVRSGRGLSRFAAATLAFMVLVILEGAVVRATGSGAGCGKHWPLCNGQIIPHHPRIATMIEFAHRSLTGICSTLVALMIVWVFASKRPGTKVRRAAVLSGILLLTEALLGAVLVLGGYVEHNTSNARVFVQCVHFTNTMLLVAALSLTWWWSRQRLPLPLERNIAERSVQGVTWTTLVATMVVGATGSVAALADTLFPSPSVMAGLHDDFAAGAPLLVRMRWMHPAATLVVMACVGWMLLRVRTPQTKRLAWLMVVQLVFGVMDVLLLAPTWMQVVHLAGADAFWIALVCLASDILSPPATAVVQRK